AREGMERRPAEAKPAAQADWRAAAFPDENFDASVGDDWRDPSLAPFPAGQDAGDQAPSPDLTYSSFGGADVAAALEDIEAGELSRPQVQTQPFGRAAAPEPAPTANEPAAPAVEPGPAAEDDFAAETDFV